MKRTVKDLIEFRDTTAGRQACIQGSSLAVWEVVLIARSHKNIPEVVAKHLRWPEAKVRAALNYARAFPKEIESALSENSSMDFGKLSRMLPHMAEFVVKPRTR